MKYLGNKKLTEATDLIKAFGWKKIKAKDWWLWSFIHEESGDRLNLYYTKMTIMVQTKDGHFKVWKSVHTLEGIENILEERKRIYLDR